MKARRPAADVGSMNVVVVGTGLEGTGLGGAEVSSDATEAGGVAGESAGEGVFLAVRVLRWSRDVGAGSSSDKGFSNGKGAGATYSWMVHKAGRTRGR